VNVYLGVDGGGTKTALTLVAQDGAVLAALEAPGCYYLGSDEGLSLVSRVLADGVARLCAGAGLTPAAVTYAFFGLPGYGEVSADVALLDEAPRSALGHQRFRCDNDMVCGWAGSLGLADGINVISGTGSMAYGQRGEERVRIGGWSELFGDEGSGYWIAVRGLQAFSRMSDGRLPAGPLLGVLSEHLALETDLDLVDVVVNQWQGDRGRIAALSRQVVKAAQQGDAVAASILDAAAAELVSLVETAAHRLEFASAEPVAVSYSGGVFSATEVLSRFSHLLGRQDTRYTLRTPLFSPVIGAALFAARLAGSPLDESAVQALRVRLAS
jgi:N-acetylglucosamine kinase-like BadF-type ATPase